VRVLGAAPDCPTDGKRDPAGRLASHDPRPLARSDVQGLAHGRDADDVASLGLPDGSSGLKAHVKHAEVGKNNGPVAPND
jgi:hypothetical protein